MSSRESPIAAQRARNARLTTQAEQLALADRAEYGLPELPVILLPANSRNTTELPEESHDAFLEKLRGTIAEAFGEAVRDNSAPMSAEATQAREDAGWALPESIPAMPDIIGASCGTCRGECCTAGGTHGFLHADSIMRVRAQLTDDGETVTPESLEERYASHLPTRHYRGSCVFHTTAGCNLPRALRSNLCNRYVCGGLAQLTRALVSTAQTSAYVAAADSVHLRRMALVTVTGSRSLALRDG
ncbi:hypothetical protein [Gemmatimonas groenlandica]|uniref:Uncharacterized protein n=1 Tax=Gemmatimonas groenlandica TaxID=2732249 RepID=A0A6M4IUT1_9BACT|nr:hypothetical protein [Gemmatimonas groenlandica]QJR36572.1 hypothetical protein HKW67_14175 [Gemmatimonas groenlandica]